MTRNLVGQSPSATFICSQESPQSTRKRLRRLFLTSILAATLGICFTSLRSNEASAANSDLADFQLRLQDLRTASSVVLMLVPYPTYLLTAVDESMLRDVSCQYEINSGPVFDEVLRILGDNVIEHKVGPKPNVGLYVGIIFKANTKVVQEFYLNDSRGSFNLVGYSGDRAIAALASLPRQLRKLVIQANVVLVKAPHSVCPDT
jgi:hypothetical protein